MKLALHVSPTRTSIAVDHDGPREVSARVTENCDAIASFLRDAGAAVQILEEPAMSHTNSDYSLVFARDLEWHLTEGRRPNDQLVVLHADRDEILDIVETHRVAAAVHYMQVDAFTKDNRGLVVRRDIAERLGGTLLVSRTSRRARTMHRGNIWRIRRWQAGSLRISRDACPILG